MKLFKNKRKKIKFNNEGISNSDKLNAILYKVNILVDSNNRDDLKVVFLIIKILTDKINSEKASKYLEENSKDFAFTQLIKISISQAKKIRLSILINSA